MKPLTIPGSGRIVSWKDKSGKVVARSRPTLAAVSKPKPAEASADSLMTIAHFLAAEAMTVEDPALRSRLLNAAGRSQIKADAARARERRARKPISPAQLNAYLAEAREAFPG